MISLDCHLLLSQELKASEDGNHYQLFTIKKHKGSSALLGVINSDSYLNIDAEAPCSANNDSIEDEIVEALNRKKP